MPLDETSPNAAQRAATGTATVHSACPHDCPSTCALEVERLDPQTIGRVHGASGNPYTAGVVCAKVARYAERTHHPDRLNTPLRRTGEKGMGRSSFEPMSWDDALDEVAEQLLRVEQTYGAEAVWPYYYAGTMGLIQRDSIERLRHVKGYSRQHSTFCVALSDAGWNAGAGVKRGVNSMEMEESDLITVWGANPVHTQVQVMTHISAARKARGTKLVVVDPYRTPTAKQADIHLMLNPGTDGALACAVMHVLFKESYADRAYLARYTDAPDELERHLETRDPHWASAITGLSVEEIVNFAHLYGRTERSFIRFGYGFSRSRNGAAQMHAASCLPAVTGAWQYRGGGALYANSGLYQLDQTVVKGLDRLDPNVRLLDQSRLGPILNGDPRDLQGGPPVMALLIQNTNPMNVAPDLLQVREGFMRSDLFTCVHEQFLTETAEMADIVLPATTFVEHDDMYTASGHTYFQVTKKIIEPVGEARPNHWVLCEIAKRVGAEHPGFQMSEWELMDATLQDSGYPDADTIYRGHWEDRALPFDEAHFLTGFGHADGKFHFKPDWSAYGPRFEGMPELPDHFDVIDNRTPDCPFRLVTAPSRNYLNTSFTETKTSIAREGRPEAQIHPDACAELGLEAGGLVRIGNAQASVLLHVRPFDGVQPNTVIVEGVWPNKAFIEGIGMNALVSAEPGKPNGGAVFHDTAVWLRPA